MVTRTIESSVLYFRMTCFICFLCNLGASDLQACRNGYFCLVLNIHFINLLNMRHLCSYSCINIGMTNRPI
jgi:hypothetical protein